YSGKGGAIFINQGSAIISSVYFNNNSANGGAGTGGAVQFMSGSNHRIENSAFTNNISSSNGGGIHVHATNLTVINTTMTGNTATGSVGGGICADGAVSLTLRNNTITANSGAGGGIFQSGGTLNFGNNIIAGNVVSGGGSSPEILIIPGSNAVSVGFNFIGDSAGDSIDTRAPITYQSTDILDTPPMLSALGNYEGSTPTQKLQSGSPAIDKGKSFSSTTDQRGLARPYDNPSVANAAGGDGADIGAYELQSFIPGDLDLTFNSPRGFIRTILGDSTGDAGQAIAVDPSNYGSIVLAGTATCSPNVGGGNCFGVSRYNKDDGLLDTTFNNRGYVRTKLYDENQSTSVVVQPDRSVVVVGWTNQNSVPSRFMIARYDNLGVLDTNFGIPNTLPRGIRTAGFGAASTLNSKARVVALQREKIIVAGWIQRSVESDIADLAIIRLNSDGQNDSSFNGVGTLIIPMGVSNDSFPVSIQIQEEDIAANDKIIIGAGDKVLRILSNGTIDSSFGMNGQTAAPEAGTTIKAIARQTNGKIVCVGTKVGYNNNYFTVLFRLTSGGNIDSTFVRSDPSGSPVNTNIYSFVPTSVVLSKTGYIMIAGAASSGYASGFYFAVTSFYPNGGINRNFGIEGVVMTPFNGKTGVANGIALQSDGKIVLGGNAVSANSQNILTFAVARYLMRDL
ncbi:MAG TPA: choice-of-anchor Q domain-containing protein, partial [Pedobacter sp.]